MAATRSLELGVYLCGNTPRILAGGFGHTAQAIRDVMEAVKLAEEVGLDFFGFGELHTGSMLLSSPASLVNAAAAATDRIKLGTTVSVLSNEVPLRLFQQLATAAAIAPGRVEVVAGRGSSAITFALFDQDERDYETHFNSKLEVLLELNRSESKTWSRASHRHSFAEVSVVPQPEEPLRVWLGTGGTPASVTRAAELGVPIFLGILSGSPEYWAQYGRAYRKAWSEAGQPAGAADIAVAVHGFVGEDNQQAKAAYKKYEIQMSHIGSAEVGRPGLEPPDRSRDLERNGMVFAGDPDEIAARILHLHDLLGHSRQILQMDIGGMPQSTILRSIELLGTKVRPLIRSALADRNDGLS